ncbi:hypothetical protein C823_000211 [Eubacterium plexicaudatum ASF492]|nr:hypothetical protein C823_000211 [Eubacterium plexicaudatum ASF492]
MVWKMISEVYDYESRRNKFYYTDPQTKEEGILYVMDTFDSYLRAIVRSRLYALPDEVDECMNDIFLGIWKISAVLTRQKAVF